MGTVYEVHVAASTAPKITICGTTTKELQNLNAPYTIEFYKNSVNLRRQVTCKKCQAHMKKILPEENTIKKPVDNEPGS
jgi:hypothetical protein